MRKLLCLAAFIPVAQLHAQPAAPLPAGQPAADTISRIYSAGLDPKLPVYNGRQFFGYSPSIKGHAYFETDKWQKGSVAYNGAWYHDMLLLYDISQDQVNIQDPDELAITLFNERVKEFHIGENVFVRLTPAGYAGIKPGYYQRLAQGSATLYAKRTKILKEEVADLSVKREFISSNTYYIAKDGEIHTVAGKKALLRVLKDKRKIILEKTRQKKIRYNRNPEGYLLLAVESYNQSN